MNSKASVHTTGQYRACHPQFSHSSSSFGPWRGLVPEFAQIFVTFDPRDPWFVFVAKCETHKDCAGLQALLQVILLDAKTAHANSRLHHRHHGHGHSHSYHYQHHYHHFHQLSNMIITCFFIFIILFTFISKKLCIVSFFCLKHSSYLDPVLQLQSPSRIISISSVRRLHVRELLPSRCPFTWQAAVWPMKSDH